jgi:hypothetical protein
MAIAPYRITKKKKPVTTFSKKDEAKQMNAVLNITG